MDKEVKKIVSTTLPMLEFQVSSVREAKNFKKAKEPLKKNEHPYPGIIQELKEKKRCFRGYGVSFNPHFKEGKYLPFRIIIAGGDDLCIVMSEKYILNFAINYSPTADYRFERFRLVAISSVSLAKR